MKRLAKLSFRPVLCATLLAATPALAQKEQWLEYHTSREEQGYRWLELTTNPPPQVALPKLTGRAWFARWSSPLDGGRERWLCLDRAEKGLFPHKAYFDTNGNGRLDDDPPSTPSRSDEYSVYFNPVKAVFKGEDGPIAYHIVLRFMKYSDDTVRLLASSGGYYGGLVEIGGKKRRVQLIDGNVNATFNDRGTSPGDCDRILIEKDDAGERYLGRMIEVDGQFYQIEVARDGAFLKLQKAENLQFGKVQVAESLSQFIAFGENGHFIRKPQKGEFTLPAGKYFVNQWTINRKDKSGASWELLGYGIPDAAAFEVSADAPVKVAAGEPIRTRLSATTRTNQVSFSLSFLGPLDENIQILRGNQRPAGPRLALVSQDQSFRSTNTFEFG